jgi:hypothetical protein
MPPNQQFESSLVVFLDKPLQQSFVGNAAICPRFKVA